MLVKRTSLDLGEQGKSVKVRCSTRYCKSLPTSILPLGSWWVGCFYTEGLICAMYSTLRSLHH